MAIDLFDAPAFFIILRETLECSMILSILFGLIDRFIPSENQQLKVILKKRIWIGIGFGFFVSIVTSVIFIAIFYIIEKNNWEQTSEIWEAIFSFLATVLMTTMAFSMLKVTIWKDKIEKRLNDILANYIHSDRRYQLPLSLLPFTIICRESLETFILITGIGLNHPHSSASSLPIAIFLGFFMGILIGYLIYRGFKKISLYVFFVSTTTLLFFMGAGFFSTACDEIQGAIGSKKIILWELNCCDPSKQPGWAIAEQLFGWRNKATVASTIGYFVYWIVVIIYVLLVSICGNHNSNSIQQEQQVQQQEQPPSENNITTQEETQEISSPSSSQLHFLS